MFRLPFVVALVLVLFGCAHKETVRPVNSEIVSFVDPGFRQARFDRILVVVESSDLFRRNSWETSIVRALESTGVIAVASVTFFPPTRELSNADKYDLVLASNLNGYLSVSIGDPRFQQVYIPPATDSYTTTNINVNRKYGWLTGRSQTSTITSGGYTQVHATIPLDFALYDIGSGQMAWRATSPANGDDPADAYWTMVVRTISRDGLIPYAMPAVIGSSEFRTLHRPDCKWLKTRPATDRVQFSSFGVAQRSGYVPCQICKPAMTPADLPQH